MFRERRQGQHWTEGNRRCPLKIVCLKVGGHAEFVSGSHAWQDSQVEEPSLCPSIDFHAYISFSVEQTSVDHCLFKLGANAMASLLAAALPGSPG